MPVECEFVSPLGAEALLFRRMAGREELGRLFEYRLELLRPSKKDPVKPKDLLGQTAGLRILLPDGAKRSVNGVVTRFEHGGVVGRFDIYRLELRPWLWHLNLGADCRIFQDKSALEIIKEIFAEYGSSSAIEDKLSGPPAKRPYTVQYRESDFNFVSRLMEEEGIYYYFKHTGAQHSLVLCNSAAGHGPIKGKTLSWAATAVDGQLRDDVITRWDQAHQLRSLKYAHTDYAAEAPATSLMASALRTAPYPKPDDLEVYDYPGGHDDLAMGTNTGSKVQAGTDAAQIKVNIFDSGHSVASGITAWRELLVGSTFGFSGLDSGAGDYLVTSAVYEMEFAGYEANDDAASTSYSCHFNAVPKTVKFQPEPQATRPIVQGPQTATVVGASGDEIHTEKYGRVKLQFHWDRKGEKNEKSSCWVRVSHPMASKGFGMIALPRVGDEVVVDFLEGNPDRPLVTGRVYNGTNMPPYELPTQATVAGLRTRSSKSGSAENFNELRFDDKKGDEYVWFQAEKDFYRFVKKDAFDEIGQHSQLTIAKNHTAKVGEDYAMDIGKSAALKMGTDVHAKAGGDTNVEIGGALNLKMGGATAFKTGAALAISAGAATDIKAGADIKATAGATMHFKAGATLTLEAAATISIKAGAGWITIGPDGVSIGGPLVKINSGGSASAASAAKDASPTAPTAPAAVVKKDDPLAAKKKA